MGLSWKFGPYKWFIFKWLQGLNSLKLLQLKRKIFEFIAERRDKKTFSDIYLKYKTYSMIPKDIFIENLYLCKNLTSVNGCVVECGVWRGGMTAAMADVLGSHRKYYLFDSFEGLPQARDIDGEDAIKWQQDTSQTLYYDNCRAEMEYAEKAMRLSNAKHYQLIKGWFLETLPGFIPEEPIAVLRLDGDWYESTLECLNSLYKYVAKGGLIIIDDYYTWDGCSKAVHDFLSTNELVERISQSKNGVCYIIKK